MSLAAVVLAALAGAGVGWALARRRAGLAIAPEVGPHLLKLPAWQTSVDDLMQSERDHLAEAFGIDRAKVAISIGKRYQAFMLQGA